MSGKVMALVFTALLSISGLSPARAQSKADKKPAVETFSHVPTMLVDCPTAGTLRRGEFDAYMRAYPRGGIMGGTDIGLTNRLMVGISYGAEGIIAEESPNWNPRIEFSIKLSLIDEGLVFPAVTGGFCSQGYGSWDEVSERYTFKSKGFYAVASKNYPVYDWQLGLHGGLNYSMEKLDNDDNINFFVGLDTRLNKDVGLVAEYDFATNDNLDNVSLGKGRGYFNLALQWLYTDHLVMEVLLKNINNNRKHISDVWRGLRVVYTEAF